MQVYQPEQSARLFVSQAELLKIALPANLTSEYPSLLVAPAPSSHAYPMLANTPSAAVIAGHVGRVQRVLDPQRRRKEA